MIKQVWNKEDHYSYFYTGTTKRKVEHLKETDFTVQNIMIWAVIIFFLIEEFLK